MTRKLNTNILIYIGNIISFILDILLLKKPLLYLLFSTTERKVYSLKNEGYLKDMGWLNSFEKGSPVGKHNDPLPWVTYPFIDFIAGRLKKNMDIFEFGSGNSTLYYAYKVGSITTVEHDKEWYQKMESIGFPANVHGIYQELKNDGKYSNTASLDGKKYDIIIVDGRDRVNCVKNALVALKNHGIIILDDSEREEYKSVFSFMEMNEFKKIDFWGVAPGLSYKKNTTIFYRVNNCLGI
jgi:hypothetical protein